MTVSTILIPLDSTEQGLALQDYGIYCAKRLNSRLIGLYVIDLRLVHSPVFTDISGSMGLTPYQDFLPIMHTTLEERADSICHAFLSRCESSGVHAETKKTFGIADHIIIEEAQQAELIILPREGDNNHPTGSSFPISTIESVIRKVYTPVMVTPAKFIEIESMGLAYDGSAPAKKALTLSVHLSQSASWPLTVITITDDPSRGAHLVREVEDYLEGFNIDSEVIILGGKEESVILAFMEEGSIELMVMGTHGYNRLKELLLGSTTSHIIRKSKIPVLLTR